MLNKVIQINISPDVVAWYGALVATGSLILSVYKVWVDKARLRFFVKLNNEIWGTDINNVFKNLGPEKKFWTIQIANVGRRNLVIDAVGVEWRDKQGGALISRDYNGPLQRFELKPEDSKTIVIDSSLIDPHRVKNIYVIDATGKEYRHKLKV